MRIRHGVAVTRSWLDLPDIFLQSVFEQLDNRNDICRFRSVCQKWRYSVIPTCSKACHSMLLPFKIPSIQSLLLSHLVLVSSSVTILRPLAPPTDIFTTTAAAAVAVATVPPWIVRAEEVNQPNKGNVYFRNPVTGDRMIFEQSDNLPPNLDLTQFHVSELFTGFNLTAHNNETASLSSSSLGLVDKVLAMPVAGPRKDCFVLMAVLYNWGTLAVYSIKGYYLTWCPKQHVTAGKSIHDVAIFRGNFCAIDDIGRLYQVDSYSFDSVIIGYPVLYPFSYHGRRKRLVVSGSGDLYLVVRYAREQGGILVYMFKFMENCCVNSSGEQGMWEEVNTLDGKVMVLSADQGFFASAADFPGHDLANCVVFSTLSFGVGEEIANGQRIGVFRLGDTNHDLNYLKVDSLAYVWSPPSWLCKPHTSPPERETWGEDKKACSFFSGLEFHTSAEKNKFLIPESRRSYTENELSDLEALKSDMKKKLADFETLKSAIETARNKERVYGEASKPAMTSLTQSSVVRAPMTKFKGLNVRSDLVPTLKKIWQKQGNIIDGCTMRNGDIIARALESLATIKLFLKESKGSSITKEQVIYMHSTLSDLQHMKLDVKWLVPFVEKATDCYATSTLISTLNVIDKVRVRASETKAMLRAELSMVEKIERAAVDAELDLSTWLACFPDQLKY